jgi:hypothetical protein
MIRFIDTLFTQLGTTGNYSAIADLHTLQFTVTHALGFSVFTSRILPTDFHTVVMPVSLYFKWHMKSSCRGLIRFLPFLLNHLGLISPERDPILDNQFKRRSLSLYNPSAWTMQKTQALYCWEGLFTDPLPSNGRPIVARVRSRGNVFTESLPSNGSIRHSIYVPTYSLNHLHYIRVYLLCRWFLKRV